MEVSYKGEVQFSGYSDSSRGGPRITLRLADRADLETWVGKEGKRYMAVLVEIGDDEQPVEPEKPAAKEKPKPSQTLKRPRMAPLCEWAVMRCADPEFQRWVSETMPESFAEAYADRPAEELAKAAILHLCGVTSRKDLDTDNDARARFNRLVRVPYAEWLKSRSRVTRDDV